MFLFRPKNLPAGLYCLTYHGLIEQKKKTYWERNFTSINDFKEHLKYIGKHEVISTYELIDALTNSRPFNKPTFYITFDDGYENNLIAADMMASYKYPWSVFVSTNSINDGDFIWTIDLALLFKNCKVSTINYRDVWYDVYSEEKKIKVFNIIRKIIKKLNKSDRIVELKALELEINGEDLLILRSESPQFKMMNWQQINQIATYAEIGSHGESHELLHENQGKSVIISELHNSKGIIEQQTKKTCNIIAYPNGDFTEEVIKEVKKANYKLGFTTVPGKVIESDHLFQLPRIDALHSVSQLHKTIRKL